jgi:hypothetical protein
MEANFIGYPFPKALPPTKDNGYRQRDRPLSFQPRFAQVKTQPVNNYGFPEPGIQVRPLHLPLSYLTFCVSCLCPTRLSSNQSPTTRQVIAKDYLISDETWEDVCNNAQDIDFIVIGSGVSDRSSDGIV